MRSRPTEPGPILPRAEISRADSTPQSGDLWQSPGVASLRPRRLDLGEARRLYESGLSFAQVGLELGYSATWLARLFKATGIPSRPDGRPLTTPAPPVDIGELVRLREVGWTYPQLGARYGLSDDAVRSRYLRAKGLPLRRAEADRRGVPFHPFDR